MTVDDEVRFKAINEAKAKIDRAIYLLEGVHMTNRIDDVITKVFAVLAAVALAFGLQNTIDLAEIEHELIIIVGASIALYHLVDAGVRGIIAHYRS